MFLNAAFTDKAITGMPTSQCRIVFEVIQFLIKLFLGQDLIEIGVEVIYWEQVSLVDVGTVVDGRL